MYYFNNFIGGIRMFTIEEQEMILAIQGLLGETIDPYEALEVYEEML